MSKYNDDQQLKVFAEVATEKLQGKTFNKLTDIHAEIEQLGLTSQANDANAVYVQASLFGDLKVHWENGVEEIEAQRWAWCELDRVGRNKYGEIVAFLKHIKFDDIEHQLTEQGLDSWREREESYLKLGSHASDRIQTAKKIMTDEEFRDEVKDMNNLLATKARIQNATEAQAAVQMEKLRLGIKPDTPLVAHHSVRVNNPDADSTPDNDGLHPG